MAIRRWEGFTRYVLAVQYHGGSHIGFNIQKDEGKNQLRGLRSVEGRILDALTSLVGNENHENLKVSSRTDRGVHALFNTCHVDIRPRVWNKNHFENSVDDDVATTTTGDMSTWDPTTIQRGLNYHLCTTIAHRSKKKQSRRSNVLQRGYNNGDDIRVLAVQPAPKVLINTKYDWHARFSAKTRRYVYRILASHRDNECFGDPFEWDRSWKVNGGSLDLISMNKAAQYLIGTHDFSSFRGRGCQRPCPIVTVNDIKLDCHSDYDLNMTGLNAAADWSYQPQASLVTVSITGTSFLYRQVRNIVGCLVKVGQGKLSPSNVKDILLAADRRKAPDTAPAHGLFLVDVEHEGFSFQAGE
mmetsp:Transcript_48305/g.71599  ORF Transcript_48305/g.71599 Transcript_48305/m.71599 type:complete len:356 (-) Transcript_48305:87-1154(-)